MQKQLYTAGKQMFADSFREFIRECGVPFTEQGWVFSFPLHRLQICLVVYESEAAPRQEPGTAVFEQVYPDTLYLYEDRWWFAPEVTRERIAARLGRFRSVFARKCKVLNNREWQQLKQASPAGAIASEAEFLNRYHAYGDAASKYRYALWWEGAIVAVATFSAPRPMWRRLAAPLENVPRQQHAPNEAIEFRSYEWVRYASLPGVRVAGGMGRLLQAFLKEVAHPDNPRFAGLPIEVMSYSDNEWSGGEVYQTLGFALAGEREAVEYYVDKTTYERFSARKLGGRYPACPGNYYRITNRGSRKYLLQPLWASQSCIRPQTQP